MRIKHITSALSAAAPRLALALALPVAVAGTVGCEKGKSDTKAEPAKTDEAKPAAGGVEVAANAKAVVAALPDGWEKDGATDDLWQLGRTLYFDKRLSKNHDISCNSCHDLAKYGVDNEPTSPGHKKQRGDRNSPTVYNAAGHFAQFWDGRAADVEAQAIGPILNPVEMAMKGESEVLTVINSMPEYQAMFKKAFPEAKDPVTYNNIGVAIGAFERKLSTPGPVDKFLKGDKTALTDAQKRGWNTFAEVGCQACHSGALLGGQMYQKAGLVKPWPNQEDKGRAAVTKNEAENLFFKVPSLRNIAKTGPYFHDGSVANLDEAVKMMGTHQLGRDLTDAQVKDIVAFLEALTGELPAELIKEPKLPAATDKTPKPDPS